MQLYDLPVFSIVLNSSISQYLDFLCSFFSVIISFNVNHTVDSESAEDEAVAPEKEEFSEMRSRPQFEIDIVRDNTTLSFTCSYIQDSQPAQEGDGYSELYF